MKHRIGDVAVITGAASGIGSALARAALERGMRVVLADIDTVALETFAQTLEGEVATLRVDVSDPSSVEQLAEFSYDRFGQVDLLFNNAGVLIGGKSWEIPSARWEWQMRVNVLGVVHGIASFVPRMSQSAKGGRIINTGSIGGFLTAPYLAPYNATKFAVVSISEALAMEVQSEGLPVEVSVLCPGPVRTEIFRETVGMNNDAVSDRTVSAMRNFVTGQGLSPDELARRAFDGIDAGLFWIIPQPEMLDEPYRQRVEELIARKNPSIIMPEQLP